MSLADIIIKENGWMEENDKREITNEATIAVDENKNGVLVYIDLDGSKNFGGDNAYFKCIPHNEDISTFNPARISFRNPVYLTHYKNTKQFKLNPKQKKSLMLLLSSTHISGNSVWVEMINRFNDAIMSKGKDNEKYKLPLSLPIPDYRRLS